MSNAKEGFRHLSGRWLGLTVFSSGLGWSSVFFSGLVCLLLYPVFMGSLVNSLMFRGIETFLLCFVSCFTVLLIEWLIYPSKFEIYPSAWDWIVSSKVYHRLKLSHPCLCSQLIRWWNAQIRVAPQQCQSPWGYPNLLASLMRRL